ncbi:centrosomal protein of 295 kDa [Callorhinchus milii]|uniref:centrosomal protein of 295 kDa n=1 Tax=Callorhinchus milii TaxID=7868 RepID=UPI001C3FC363|nr:centrosomal protein of 295 kDa [Callorhinchus milii]
MKRKVAKVGGLRLSPNEESILIKEELERRRKLRLKQVREQERCIALQIREEVKQRRNQQLELLADELKAEWRKAQVEKAKTLENLYLCSLKAVGDGHRQAKENEPDLETFTKQAAVNQQKAEKRCREALRELKLMREKEFEEQSRCVQARKKALIVEKERAMKIAHLPPPPPDPLAELDVSKCPVVKMHDVDSFSVTHYHLPEPCVDREMNTEQVNALLAAEQVGHHLEELQKEAERERREQLEKARLRGSHALQMVHLAQDKEKLMKELEKMQHADLTRRRRVVAQMPPQLFEPPYRRVEIKADRQREMEFAFEDMYSGDKRVRGDLVLCLEPEPLPALSVGTQDEDLDLSVDPEGFHKEEEHLKDQEMFGSRKPGDVKKGAYPRASETPAECSHPAANPTKAALKKLLTKIRAQRNNWTSRPETESSNEVLTIESGSIESKEEQQRSSSESIVNMDVGEELLVHFNKEQDMPVDTIIAGNATLFHPKEQASIIRSEIDRKKQLEELEQQKQQQLVLLQQFEQQKRNLRNYFEEAQFQRQLIQTQMEERLRRDVEDRNQEACHDYEPKALDRKEDISIGKQDSWRLQAPRMDAGDSITAGTVQHHEGLVPKELSQEDKHLYAIRQYQQRLVEQNRLHRKSVEEARKQLEEYQLMLKRRHPSILTTASQLSTKCSTSQPLHYDTPAGTQSKIDISSSKAEQSLPAPAVQHLDLVNQPTFPIRPHVDLITAGLPHTSTHLLQHSRTASLSADGKEPVPTIHLPKYSEPAFPSARCEPLVTQTLPDSAGLVTRSLPAQHVVVDSEGTHQRQIDRLFDTGEYSSGDHVTITQKQPFMCHESMGHHDLSKPEMQPILSDACRRKSPEVSESCSRATVELQQGSTDVLQMQARLMEPAGIQRKPMKIMPGSSETSLGTLRHLELSGTLVKHSEALKNQKRLTALSKDIQIRQEHLRELQQQLDRQREALFSKQMSQEEMLNDRENQLQDQMQQQKKALENYLTEMQLGNSLLHEEATASHNNDQQLVMSSLLQTLVEFETESTNEIHQLENIQLKAHEPTSQTNELFSQCYDSLFRKTGGRHLTNSATDQVLEGQLQNWRPSKPPVTKTKLGLFGLDEQHELSSIQEVETPQSDRFSIFVNRNISKGDNCYLPEDLSCSVQAENDMSVISTSSSQQSSSATNSALDSGKSGRRTWREELALETGKPPEEGPSMAPSAAGSCIPSYFAAVGGSALVYPGTPMSTCITSSQVMLPYSWACDIYGPTAVEKNPHPDVMYPSSTTLSTGSLSEQEVVSPISSGLCSDVFPRTATRPFTAPPRVSPTSTSSSPSSSGYQAPVESGDIHPCSSKLEEYSPNESKIQQIIEKYTRDLNKLMDSTVKRQASATGFDISDVEDPNFYSPLQFSRQGSCPEFCHLEPITDFGISSTSASFSSKESSVQNTTSTESQHLPNSDNASATSEIQLCQSSLASTPAHERTGCNIQEETQQNYGMENNGLESFHLLQPEITVSEYSLNTESSDGGLMNVRTLEESSHNETTSSNSEYFHPPVLLRPEGADAVADIQDVMEQLSCSDITIENLRKGSIESSQKHNVSFVDLNATMSTVNELPLNQYSIFNNQNGNPIGDECSCKMPSVVSLAKKLNSTTANEMNILSKEAPESISEENANHTVGIQHGVSEQDGQAPPEHLSPVKEETAPLENQLEQEDDQLHQSNSSKLRAGICTSCSFVPVWETESGVGIMEEPELTQVTMDDSTFVEDETTDPEGQEPKVERLISNSKLKFSQVKEFQALTEMTNDNNSLSQKLPVSNSSPNDNQSSSQRSSTVMVIEFDSSHKIFNKEILKKKQKFIANSTKRLEDLKGKVRSEPVQSVHSFLKPRAEKNPVHQDQPLLSAPSMTIQLKMVGEVKVSTPEDRKTAEIEMRQRTLRLYSQLSEVKNRNEEVMRCAMNSRNRKKAKEFQKKTLEKLRAKKHR